MVGTEGDIEKWTHSFKSSIAIAIIFEAMARLTVLAPWTDRKTTDGPRSGHRNLPASAGLTAQKRGKNSRRCKPAACSETPADSA